jgi:8-amino-3,8-dideoxy-alpha-D-manno-octulosonate transaminase
MAVARKYELPVVEDVAQSNGGCYKGRPLGSIGDVGCFSFQQYKVVTSGEGGLLATDDETIYDRARMEHDSAARFWEGKDARQYDFVLSGTNYRLSEVTAALFWAQRERLDPILARCRAVKARMVAGLAGVPGITLQDVPDPAGDCGITCTFFLPRADLAAPFARALNAENIRCGTVYDNTIADRHIYANWPFMMSGLADPRRAPWHSPFYKGDVRGYSPNQCPQSLGYLGRAVMIAIDQHFTLDDADLAVEAVRKVAVALL